MSMRFAITFTIVTILLAATSLMAQRTSPVAPVPVAAASAPAPGATHFIAIPASKHDAIDLAATKLDNLNLRFQQMTEQYDQARQQMQQEYQHESETLQSLLTAERKALGVPADAQFTGTQGAPANGNRPAKPAYSFEVPNNAPAPESKIPAAAAAAKSKR